jgi:glycosyltransferase involved in cell wall biosynthesis
MTAPLVSVVVPTYNQPVLLEQTLHSVFEQTLTDYEVVVVNDGSTDDTLKQLTKYGDRIRVVTQPNAGVGAARNRGIDEARGTYVALLDHDDLWRPNKLQIQVDFLKSHPECISVSAPWATSLEPDVIPFNIDQFRNSLGIVERPLAALAEGQLFLITSTLMFHRKRAEGLRYATQRDCIEDVPFHLGLISRGPIGLAASEVQAIYRVHGGGYSCNASFYYHGVNSLRDMHRRGEFDFFDAESQRHLKAYLAFLGRNAALLQLIGGYRGRGVKAYLRELPHQIRHARFRFLLAFPFLAAMPHRFVAGGSRGRPIR